MMIRRRPPGGPVRRTFLAPVRMIRRKLPDGRYVRHFLVFGATSPTTAQIRESATASDLTDASTSGAFSRADIEAGAASDTTDATFAIDPHPFEYAPATDAVNASFIAAGVAGPVRATQVVMEVLMPVPAPTAKLRPFVQINT